MDRFRHLKKPLRTHSAFHISEDKYEMIKLANKYPNNPKMQDYKKKLLELEEDNDCKFQELDFKSSSSDLRSEESLKEERNIFSDCNKKQAQQTTLCTGTQSMTHLQAVRDGLKACKGMNGFFDPKSAFNCLNEIQMKEDPQAYQPEVQKIIQRNLQRQKEMEAVKKKKEQEKLEKQREAIEHEKALFDFDEDIN